MLNEKASKTVYKTEFADRKRKKSKTLNEIRLMENRNKTPENFQGASHVQKGVPPLHKLQLHVYQ